MPSDTMKAIRLHEHGGPEVLRYEDTPAPSPGPARCSSGCMPQGSTRPTGTSATA